MKKLFLCVSLSACIFSLHASDSSSGGLPKAVHAAELRERRMEKQQQRYRAEMVAPISTSEPVSQSRRKNICARLRQGFSDWWNKDTGVVPVNLSWDSSSDEEDASIAHPAVVPCSHRGCRRTFTASLATVAATPILAKVAVDAGSPPEFVTSTVAATLIAHAALSCVTIPVVFGSKPMSRAQFYALKAKGT